ncbi:hypothetical protein ASE57_15620 [Sphingomonas sp. Leaf11]|nr:hypothetical protein ASE58_15620 [Sphingomonas sp. Leaf9]KQM42477.1 hypothetical protein ASE57_15620 [Sphingomonas sp. Leaf11]
MVGIAILLVPGTHAEAKINPLYWAILAVPVPWTSALLSYRPGPLRWLRVMLLAIPALAFAVAGAAWALGVGMTTYLYMIVATVVLCLAGLWAFPRSMLARHGVPDANGDQVD